MFYLNEEIYKILNRNIKNYLKKHENNLYIVNKCHKCRLSHRVVLNDLKKLMIEDIAYRCIMHQETLTDLCAH